TEIMKSGSTAWATVKDLYGKRSTSKYANITLEPGDRIRLTTPGGGGYGDPAERDPAAIAEDVAEGYVSADAAQRSYGR
ncbi:MAG TPA: hydantoinase B/oxoprolinase family protein, partial [Aestuariivirga sp.]|nr:hydantoinase B/oxoprolinase family protein [Aestuariivirga sp.]